MSGCRMMVSCGGWLAMLRMMRTKPVFASEGVTRIQMFEKVVAGTPTSLTLSQSNFVQPLFEGRWPKAGLELAGASKNVCRPVCGLVDEACPTASPEGVQRT